MESRKIGALVILPNLLLGISQGFPTKGNPSFDEGYLSPRQQVWIRYDRSQPERFSGVMSTLEEQISISGVRSGNRFLIQSHLQNWEGSLYPKLENALLILDSQFTH